MQRRKRQEVIVMSLTFDPIWPWSTLDTSQSQATGGGFVYVLLVALLVLLPLMLLILCVGSNLIGPRPAWRRTLPIALLRLLACLMVFTAILRPSLGFDDPADKHGLLIIAVDGSESMTIYDETDNQSRWDALQKILKDNDAALKKLAADKKLEVVFYRFDGEANAVE